VHIKKQWCQKVNK